MLSAQPLCFRLHSPHCALINDHSGKGAALSTREKRLEEALRNALNAGLPPKERELASAALLGASPASHATFGSDHPLWVEMTNAGDTWVQVTISGRGAERLTETNIREALIAAFPDASISNG